MIEMASSDLPEGTKTLIEGLSKKKDSLCHLIHLSGTGVLVELSEPSGAGKPSPPSNCPRTMLTVVQGPTPKCVHFVRIDIPGKVSTIRYIHSL